MALQIIQNFYHTMHPAQFQDGNAFVWLTGIPHHFFNIVVIENAHDLSFLIPEKFAEPLSIWCSHDDQFKVHVKCPIMTWNVCHLIPNVMSVSIQHANFDEFHKIIAQAFSLPDNVKKSYQQLLENAQAENYLIYQNHLPIGTGTILSNNIEGAIFNIAILPSHQKLGFGKAMMHFLMQRAADLKLQKLVLLSAPEAENFYVKLGFSKSLEVNISFRNITAFP